MITQGEFALVGAALCSGGDAALVGGAGSGDGRSCVAQMETAWVELRLCGRCVCRSSGAWTKVKPKLRCIAEVGAGGGMGGRGGAEGEAGRRWGVGGIV